MGIIAKGLRVDARMERDIRDAMKKEMERRHLIGVKPDLLANREQFAEVFTQLEATFPTVFRQEIPKDWLERCKLGMARKITNSYLHNRKRKRCLVKAPPLIEATPRGQLLPLGETGIFARSSLTSCHTIFHAPEIIKEKKPPCGITSEELEFSMFKELLREEGVFRPCAPERIMCKIGGNNVEVDTARKFKAAVLQMYRSGENPIAFTVEAVEGRHIGIHHKREALTQAHMGLDTAPRVTAAKSRKAASGRRR